jgi:hypothetical protein
MKRTLALIPVVALSLFTSGVLLAQESPFFGTWKLNVAKSKYSGEKPPQSATRTLEPQGDGEKVTVQGIAADGSPFSFSYTSSLDGKDSPYSGTNPFGADTNAVTRVDANTHTGITKKAGKTLTTSRAVVSKDGKVLTITTKGMNAQGQPISETTVWDKQ